MTRPTLDIDTGTTIHLQHFYGGSHDGKTIPVHLYGRPHIYRTINVLAPLPTQTHEYIDWSEPKATYRMPDPEVITYLLTELWHVQTRPIRMNFGPWLMAALNNEPLETRIITWGTAYTHNGAAHPRASGDLDAHVMMQGTV